MTNTTGGGNNTPEGGVENPQNTTGNLYKKLYQTYIKGNLEGKKNKTKFINELMSEGEMTDARVKDIQRFVSIKDEFSGLGISKTSLNIYELRNQVAVHYHATENKRTAVKSVFQKNYEITSDQYNTKLKAHIAGLSDDELSDLLKSQVQQQSLLKQKFGEKKSPKTKNLKQILDGINIGSKIEKKIGTLEVHDQQKLNQAFLDVSTTSPTSPNFYKTLEAFLADLYEYDILNDSEKVSLIKNFISHIPLSEAQRIGVISSDTAQKIKQNSVAGLYYNKKYDSLSDSEKDEIAYIISGVNSNEFMIPLEDIKLNGPAAKEMVENHVLEAIGKNITEKTGELNAEMSLEGLKAQLQKLHPGLNESIGYFSAGGILEMQAEKISIYEQIDTSTEAMMEGEKPSQQEQKEQVTYFMEIVNIDEEKGEVRIKDRGRNAYDISAAGERKISFLDFIELMQGTTEDVSGKEKTTITGAQFYSKDLMNERVKDKKVKTISNDLPDQRSELETNDKIEDLKQEHLSRVMEENGMNEKQARKYLSDGNDEEYNDASEKIYSFNFDMLKVKIDDLDSEGVGFGLEAGTAFSISKDKKDFIYTVTSVDTVTSEIQIISQYGPETFSFEQFFSGFSQQEGKRLAKETNFNSMFDYLAGSNDAWKTFEYKNEQIQKKDTENKIGYDYLVATGDKGGLLIHIEEIVGENHVKVKFGTAEGAKKKYKDEKGKEQTHKYDKFSTSKQEVTIGVGALQAYIEQFNMEPRSLDEHTDLSSDEEKDVGLHKGFWAGFFGKKSLAEIFNGLKFGQEAIAAMLAEGRDEHAADFALGVFKFLPEEIKADLTARKEQAEKKRMDDYVQKLKDIDSGPATKMIKRHLQDLNSPMYKKIGGTLFMVEKYGVLYAKGGLEDDSGSFLFYRALGGKIGDARYRDTEKKCAASGQPFSEEELVYYHLIGMCKELKIRSRVHKEYKKYRSIGKQEEFDTGKNDAGDIRTGDGRLEFIKGEYFGGTYPNALGGQEKLIDKGHSMDKMSQFPFVFLITGDAYDMDANKMTDMWKALPDTGRPVMIQRFMSDTKDMELMNDVLLQICQRLGDIRGGKYTSIHDQLADIISAGKKKPLASGERTKNRKKAWAFFDTYGKIITDVMYGLHTGDTSNESVLNHMILIEKDDHVDAKGIHKKGNASFKAYFDKMGEFTDTMDFTTSEEHMNDAFRYAGTSGISGRQTAKLLAQVSGGGFRFKQAGPSMWQEICFSTDAMIKKQNTYDDFHYDQKKVLKEKFRDIVGGLMESHASGRTLQSFNQPGNVFYPKLKEWGVDFKEISHLNADMLFDHTNVAANQALDTIVSRALGVQKGRNDESDLFDLIKKSSRQQVNDNLPNENT